MQTARPWSSVQTVAAAHASVANHVNRLIRRALFENNGPLPALPGNSSVPLEPQPAPVLYGPHTFV